MYPLVRHVWVSLKLHVIEQGTM